MMKKAKSNCTYQFMVELKYFKPRIWRRFEIGAGSSLADLGYALIVMFEAQASHLFHFYDSKTRDIYYECACAELIGASGAMLYRFLDARDFILSEIFPEAGSKLEFEYDFGDSWEFEVKLEKIIDRVPELKITSGAGYGIIEDCGGIASLNHIVELCKERGSKEYKETARWMDMIGLNMDKFDINEFSYEVINKSLRGQVKLVKQAYEDNI